MTRTVQEVVTAARDCINDADLIRYQDSSLIRFTREAVQFLRINRPDLFIGNWSTPDIGALTDTLPTPDELFQGIVHFVSGMAEIKDDEYANNGRASLVLQLGERYLK